MWEAIGKFFAELKAKALGKSAETHGTANAGERVVAPEERNVYS
jgi:hypothetical protein